MTAPKNVRTLRCPFKAMKMNIFARLKRAAAIVFAALVCLSFTVFGGGRYALKPISASADGGNLIEINRYQLEMNVRADRKIEVKEQIQVKFLASGLSMFYRSLPVDGARYSDITAACPGNPDFEYYVEDNPDTSLYFDINCVGGVSRGAEWVYHLSYTMIQGVDTNPNGMILDVVGFGWTVPLNNVSVDVYFPDGVQNFTVYSDIFGSDTENVVKQSLSADKKTLYMEADVLDYAYSEKYNEYVAGGITLEFELPEGALNSYGMTRLFTDCIWTIALGVVGCLALALLLRTFTRSVREVATVVNLKVPEGMDPLKMGKWLDGTADNEDITAMLYYFANNGYLKIDFSNEDDPCLISCVGALPNNAPVYQKTLFHGLFSGAGQSIYVSQAAGKFYDAMQNAKIQAPKHPAMYEKKSVWGYVGSCIIGAILGFLTCYLMGKRMGGGYTYVLGILFALPIFAIGVMGYVNENYRYKWRSAQRMGMLVGQVAIAAAWTVIFTIFFAEYFMTGWEKVLLSLGVFGCAFIAQGTLSRSEGYVNSLSDILGFKEFIVATEEDKIKYMLETEPELYYNVLPYAQVLGVTDEWESKFQKLTIEPPTWYVGSTYQSYSYYRLHRTMNSAMSREIAAEMARRSNSGGGHVGSSGGGGSFGGFGGGGFGGGGGGAR